MLIKLLLAPLLFAHFAAAQSQANVVPSEPALEAPSPEAPELTMGARRELSHGYALAELSPLDLVVPMKIGVLAGLTASRTSSYEVEYLQAGGSASWIKVGIGDYYDRRLSILRRISEFDNSFNFHFGVVLFESGVSVGNNLLSTATGFDTSLKLMHERALGLELGLGNRWILKNGITIGIDWASLAQPIVKLDESSEIINYIKDQEAKSFLQDCFQALLYFPRLSFLKVGLGYTF